MAITATIPTLSFPNRGVLERDAFVVAQETAQDGLSGSFTTNVNLFATQANALQEDVNYKWNEVKNQAVDGGYSQAYITDTFYNKGYIDTNFVNKDINALTAKTTPIDADLFYLGDSASIFSLKKLSLLNLITKVKSDIITAFGVLINGLTSKATPIDADSFIIADSASANASKKTTLANLKTTIFNNTTLTGTPIAPTQTAQDNSAKIATTAYVDSKMVRGTAVNASNTSIDFTGIPSWAKKITVMINGVSLSGSSDLLVQIGDSGGIETSGYVSASVATVSAGSGVVSSTTGFIFTAGGSTRVVSGIMELCNVSENSFVSGHYGKYTLAGITGGGDKTLSSTLDRIRITTANGTDSMDSGSINILYEG